jgi:hypothetical protein
MTINEDELIEAIAEYTHSLWSEEWRYMLTRFVNGEVPIIDGEVAVIDLKTNLPMVGAVVIPKGLAEFYTKKAEEPHTKSDREEARKILDIMQSFYDREFDARHAATVEGVGVQITADSEHDSCLRQLDMHTKLIDELWKRISMVERRLDKVESD